MDHDDVDRLYQGPLDAFIDARNALAKTTRRADLKTLPKPSLPAWAVNQLYWHHRPVVDRLVAAADAVRGQHQRLLAGEPANLRDAELAHRDAMRDAVAAVRDTLTLGGHALTSATLDAIRDTLQALPSPEANGRLVRPLTPRGLEALSGLAVAARPGPAPAVAREPERATTDDAAARLRAVREAEAAARAREARRQQAEAALANARAALARAEAAVEQAERDLATRQVERQAARDVLKAAQREFETLSFGR